MVSVHQELCRLLRDLLGGQRLGSLGVGSYGLTYKLRWSGGDVSGRTLLEIEGGMVVGFLAGEYVRCTLIRADVETKV